jgi:hypothetical protein
MLMTECSFEERPNGVSASRLWQILEDSPLPKYYLSETACLGILRRAKRRGRDLPADLWDALVEQAGPAGAAFKRPGSDEENAALERERERSRSSNIPEHLEGLVEPDGDRGNSSDTLRRGCGQGESDSRPEAVEPLNAICTNGEIAGTLDANYWKGCGERNGIERDVVLCVGNGQLNQMSMAEVCNTLDTMHDKQAILITRK